MTAEERALMVSKPSHKTGTTGDFTGSYRREREPYDQPQKLQQQRTVGSSFPNETGHSNKRQTDSLRESQCRNKDCRCRREAGEEKTTHPVHQENTKELSVSRIEGPDTLHTGAREGRTPALG